MVISNFYSHNVINWHQIKNQIEEMRNDRNLTDVPDWCSNEAEALVNTTLVMNARMSAMKPRFERFKSKFPDTMSVDDLARLIDSFNEAEFCKEVLDLNITKPDFRRYRMLKGMIAVFQELDIYEWAKNFDVIKRKSDPIFQIYNVGLATIQNLRICLKIPTLKPDVRVKKDLTKLGFNFRDDVEVIQICELISQHTGYSLFQLDQIFWYNNKSKDMVDLISEPTKEDVVVNLS